MTTDVDEVTLTIFVAFFLLVSVMGFVARAGDGRRLWRGWMKGDSGAVERGGTRGVTVAPFGNLN
jgi:hypothetical protein